MIRGKHRKGARSTDETVNGDPARVIEERRARRRGGKTWTGEWWEEEGSSRRCARDENPGGYAWVPEEWQATRPGRPDNETEDSKSPEKPGGESVRNSVTSLSGSLADWPLARWLAGWLAGCLSKLTDGSTGKRQVTAGYRGACQHPHDVPREPDYWVAVAPLVRGARYTRI
ncbi:hypothetical protein BO78DRAFT_87115 [Aspergillus sclerotiicarbonarius CBS 121057]|uniref:Uncharacterized protein n=1 Tax=Aspergillus sclerotiicarbonarius (strain CBS 121057 / IBT 28362) TaxID=1448318 RepID=A0A319ELR9_ASPSB|nr:hypothetical protein BO78DRAFT_87115 [Aspergillus sclerotiicarbonarius CBS 121057]